VVTAEDPEQNCFKGGAYRPHQRYEKEEKQEAASFEELAALKKDCSHNVTQNQARARVAAQEPESSARGSGTSLEGWLQDEALGGHE
jgi:hypothetical protein